MSEDLKAELVEMIADVIADRSVYEGYNAETQARLKARNRSSYTGLASAIADRLLASGLVAEQRAVGVDRDVRDISGETVMGLRVAAWMWEEPLNQAKLATEPPSEIMVDKFARHWSTGPKTAERLFRESDVRALIEPLLQSARPTPWQAIEAYDAGLLNDFGGGNVEWWQDYLRAELCRAHDFYSAEIGRLNEALNMVAAEREAWKLRAQEDTAALVRVRNLANIWRTEAQRSTQTESGYTVRGQAARDAADMVFDAIHGDAMRAALDTLPPPAGVEWRAIETAPRDGTPICVAVEDEPGRWRFWQDYWRKYQEPYGEGFGFSNARATHWTPLPQPPLAQPGSQGGDHG